MNAKEFNDNVNNYVKAATPNGSYEVGISAGSDKALLKEDRLHINPKIINQLEKMKFAMSHIRKESGEPELAFIMKKCAIIAVFHNNWIPQTKNDFELTEEEGSNKDFALKDETLLCKVITLIVATKISFFTTNHHTGQGEITGYPRKILRTLFNIDMDKTREFTNVVHNIGHWADTRRLLHGIGFEGITSNYTPSGLSMIVLSYDVTLRLSAMPAGTARLSLCYSICNRLSVHPLLACVTNISIFDTVYDWHAKVMKSRTNYHVSAKYLTSKDRYEYEDRNFDNALAILGTFICIIYPDSSLAKSPLLSKRSGFIYKEFEGFDETFARHCQDYKIASATMNSADMSELMPKLGSNIGEQLILNKQHIKRIKENAINKVKGD